MSHQEEIVIDSLEPIGIPYRIAGKSYLLREADEGAAIRYRDAQIACAQMADGKVVGVRGAAGVQALLVSLCLFERPNSQDLTVERPVPLSVIKSWPAKVIRQLFEKVRDISDLSEQETPEQLEEQIAKLQERLAKLRAEESKAKNEPNATTDTSV